MKGIARTIRMKKLRPSEGGSVRPGGKDDLSENGAKRMKKNKGKNRDLLKVEASGGKEAPASLLVSLNGVGDSAGSVAENSKFTFLFLRKY